MRPEIEPEVILTALATYSIAAIPFGPLFCELFGAGDVRAIGSGNIGATNVLRTGNKKAAALTLLCDALKGALPVAACGYFLPGYEYFMGCLAVFAHVFPVYSRFKGGKGVATALGVYLAWNWLLGLGLLVVWVTVAKLFKISSLAALIATVAAPLLIFVFRVDALLPYSLSIAVLILFTHRANVKRLLSKTEPPVSLP